MAHTREIATLVASLALAVPGAAFDPPAEEPDDLDALAWLLSDMIESPVLAVVFSPAAFTTETESHDPFSGLTITVPGHAESIVAENGDPPSRLDLRLAPVVEANDVHDADALVIEPLSSDRLEHRAAEVRLGPPLGFAAVGREAMSRGAAARLDRRMTAGFGSDAEELTPLSEAFTVMQWDVGEWLHLRGTGVGRRPDEDERRFLAIGAEAGVDLSHNAGLRFGYEFLRAGAADSMGSGLGADTLFARLQLRF
ncbi:MAG: hypothetical protein DYG93_06630 [Leptolyngbya sp. PLA2]|nr:hypothetical protein [Leptolyngbya sp.]MCE7971325.1 hypothetical protein [Leptolyngbya sp. PL-A2]MCQ3940542.1 hypothetical protein [cyanobacterium CYA1]MCZ7632462.1 hypothetical protein [Phycisphaerales bacterium]MDL1903512.1 hypothetical protein [Synechococcales cyanobacterium CNB]GIK19983.1 MAG: hypothetical protein BroJett004_21470 [Planctomycetota bacterium]